MIGAVFFIVLIVVISTLVYYEDKRTRQRYPEMFVEPSTVDFCVRVRRAYIHNNRKRLRREQRNTQQKIQQLVKQLSKMEKSK